MGHGGLLAGRYRLEEPVGTGSDGSLWRAVDETLDRPVSVRLVRPGHPFAADVIDAARRAALVEDSRLVRVLDVGESDGSPYIVAESLVGRTLEELLAAGPLPADLVRGVVGEAAQALDRASARGLHHLRLTPASVVVADDGAVTVVGTAVEAALAGVEPDSDPVKADRADAVGLVRLLYAGLTGRWSAPVETPPEAGTVPPRDLVPGVPYDLDTLCAVTLGPHGDGPASPGDLARQLAPWTSVAALPRSMRAAASTAVPSAPGPDVPGPPDEPGPAVPELVEPVPEPAADLHAPATHAPAGTNPVGPSARHATPARGLATGRGLPIAADAELPTLLPVDLELLSAASVPAPLSGAVAGTAGGRQRGRSRGSEDDWSLLGAPGLSGAPAASDRGSGEPAGSLLAPGSGSRPPRDHARLALAALAGLMVVSLIIAVFALRGLGSSTALMSPRAIASPQASAAAAPAPASSAGQSTSGNVEISGIQAIDPQGDGNENGSTADHAIDGDPSTSWHSDRYGSADFGGLKHGLGLYLMMNGGVVHSVTVTMSGTGGTVELRTAPGPGLDSSVVVATGRNEGGKAVLTPTTPITPSSLLLWFTSLPLQSSGEYRLVVSEITVS